MYVVGQYPRFLRASHLNEFKSAVHKLFKFMHETHPGVQDMACDTFLKIVQNCKRRFVIWQVGEKEPFVSELLKGLSTTITDLEPHQILTFYETVCHIIQAESDPQIRDDYVSMLMDPPIQRWAEIIGQGRQSVDVLKNPDLIKAVLLILKTNTCIATSLGTFLCHEIQIFGFDGLLLGFYRMYSELISIHISEGGPDFVELLRSVKREILKLVGTFLEKTDLLDEARTQKFLLPMMTFVLGDYASNVTDARESEVLSFCATIINNCVPRYNDEGCS